MAITAVTPNATANPPDTLSMKPMSRRKGVVGIMHGIDT